jgi:hypothetical protein
MLMAVASMIVPSVGASVSTARKKQWPYNPAFEESRREANKEHMANPKQTNGRGMQKPLVNNGLIQTGLAADRFRDPNYVAPWIERDNLIIDRPGINSKISSDFMDRVHGKVPATLTDDMRTKMNWRGPNPATESVSARKAKLDKVYAESRRGLQRGTTSTSNVLPPLELGESATFSTSAFIGLSGTEDFFDQTVLVSDADGTLNTENDFAGGNSPRTAIDSQGQVSPQGILLPDEVYTDVAVSGHNYANGFLDYNVFYTGTNAGFLTVEGDTVCDGDLLADTPLAVISFVGIPVGGVPLSPSVSVVGIAVEQDAEIDGDFASDEVVWVSVFDPEHADVAAPFVSCLFAVLDLDFDDIPESPFLFATSTLIATGGVTVDSFGDVYWHRTDGVVGTVVKAWDVTEDRFPDVGFTTFNLFNTIDIVAGANCVEMTMDKNDVLYMAMSANGPSLPAAFGLPGNVVYSYVDRCGDFDPNTGIIPRYDQFCDTSLRIYAADSEVTSPAGAGGAGPALVLPEMKIDYSGYAGLATDYDNNLYIAVGAAPAGQSGDQSPFFGFILRIPDSDCDRVGDSIDMDDNGVFGYSDVSGADGSLFRDSDYNYMMAPLNPPELTPNGIDGIDFGPLYSLNRTGETLGDDDGISRRFDFFDDDKREIGGSRGMNNIAGGRTDLLFPEECDSVGTNLSGGAVGFEFLLCDTAWTGFELSSNGQVVFVSDNFGVDPSVLDFSPTIPEYLSGPPRVTPAWADFSPGFGGQFSVHRLGFAATDAFIIQWINTPEFGLGGAFYALDYLGLPTRGSINSFDVTFYDDQDAWDDVDAEVPWDGTNLDDTINDDNDGASLPQAFDRLNSLEDPRGPSLGNRQIINRNLDADTTDENLASFAQEGVGRTIPEQGPFKFQYHLMEIIGASNGSEVITGYTVGFDGVFNTGTIPPGLCETNLSEATPSPDDPFYYDGCIGCGTEPSLYEFFGDGLYGFVNPDGTITYPVVDFDLRAEFQPDCVLFPNKFLDDTTAECLCFKGANMPIGLFCTDDHIADDSANDNPFDGPTTFEVDGFWFPKPDAGDTILCPQYCGAAPPPDCRTGKTVTYTVIFSIDEDCDGFIDAVRVYGEPDVVVNDEWNYEVTIDWSSDMTLCGGCVYMDTIVEYGFADNNKFFELQQLDADPALEVAPVTLVCFDFDGYVFYRDPIVLSIAPDAVDCDDPDDPDNVEDVQIAGICFFGDIVGVTLGKKPQFAANSGSDIVVLNPAQIVNIDDNICTAVIDIDDMAANTPYYVFVTRGDGSISTDYPNPLGFDVTFTCREDEEPQGPVLTSCRVVRTSTGGYKLQVNGTGFLVNNTIVLLNGTPCKKNKYPSKYIQSNGTTTRINCSGGLKNLLPAVVTTRNVDGTLSQNSLNCDF